MVFITLLIVAAGISAPHSLSASASGRVFEPVGKKVCHYVTKKVHGKRRRVKSCRAVKLVPTATPTGTPAPGPQIFVQPDIATIDSAGNILVGDSGAGQIVKLTAQGGVMARWSIPQDSIVKQGPVFSGMTVDRSGDILVTDEAGFRILKLSPSGQILTAWDVPSKANPFRYFGPYGTVIDADGNVLTADFDLSQVEKYSPSGVLLATIGHECTHPDGRPFVCLPENKIPPGALNKLSGLALDTQGNIYVADHRGSRIVKFSPSGQQLAAFGPKLPNPAGQIGFVEGVSVDSQDNMYLDDLGPPNAPRLLKLSPSGQVIGQWLPPSPYFPKGDGAFDRQGNLYLAMSADATHAPYLAKLSPDLKLLAQWWGKSEY
jgi:streptogramin lyase